MGIMERDEDEMQLSDRAWNETGPESEDTQRTADAVVAMSLPRVREV
jgi:hypothetical protein